jgi:phosphate-selective porin OprO/OprP
MFTERSLSIFALGRSKGINFSDSNKKYSWSLGAYKVEQNGKVKADGDKAYTTRVTVSPINKDNNYNHLGLAYTTRDLQGAEYEIKTNGGVDNAFSFLDTRNIATDTIVKKGAEAAWGRGQLSLQGEYQYLQIDALDIDESASYQGYYTQLSYFLTNDHRPYKKGRFSSVKPNSDKGAWELTYRKSTLQSVEIGSANKNSHIEIETTVLGVNYYATKRVKFMLNATDTETQGITSYNLAPEGSALSLRLQIKL